MENETSLWNKKQDELTVEDNLKIAGVVMIASIVIPCVVMGVIAGGAVAVEKVQARRAAKKAEKAGK